MIEFPFLERHSEKFGRIRKPIIPVRMIGPKGSLTLFMLLDSGADISMIPYSAGEEIGLEVNMASRGEVQGIGEGSVPYMVGQVNLEIEKISLSVRVVWALIEEVPFILGRLDLFNALNIEFREYKNKIILNKAI
jgi:hypothetical protein